MDSSVWRRPEDEPEDRQMCNILGQESMVCDTIICNIPYFRDAKIWIDLFASPEAGESYGADVVVAWMPAELIPPVPDEYRKRAAESAQQPEPAAPAAQPEGAGRWAAWLKKILHR